VQARIGHGARLLDAGETKQEGGRKCVSERALLGRVQYVRQHCLKTARRHRQRAVRGKVFRAGVALRLSMNVSRTRIGMCKGKAFCRRG